MLTEKIKRYLYSGDAVEILFRARNGAVVCGKKSDPEWDRNSEILDYLRRLTSSNCRKRVPESRL